MTENKFITAEGQIKRIIAIRMAPGSDVLQSLEEVANKYNIKSGLILGGAASLRKCILRNPRGYPESFPITDDVRVYTPVEGPLELLSISGNFAATDKNKLIVHAHVTVSTGCPESIAYGGHLVEGAIIYSTGEMVIAETEGVLLKRIFNEETQVYEFNPEEV